MRKTAITLGMLAAAVAAPAQANESGGEVRVEARGGIAWDNGDSEAIAGVAAGYDFDLGETVFAGVEVSGDKILADGANVVLGTTARLGIKVGDDGKLFVTGGYSFGEGEDVPHAGAGYQHAIGENVYLKAEYRHFFSDFSDVDTVAAGVGFKF